MNSLIIMQTGDWVAGYSQAGGLAVHFTALLLPVGWNEKCSMRREFGRDRDRESKIHNKKI